jgi:hypothetical protein
MRRCSNEASVCCPWAMYIIHNLDRENSKSYQLILYHQEGKCKMSLNPLCTIILSPLPKDNQGLHAKEVD